MGTTTTLLSLYKPSNGESGYDTLVNTSLDTIDTALGTEHNADGTHKVITLDTVNNRVGIGTMTTSKLTVADVNDSSVVVRVKATSGTLHVEPYTDVTGSSGVYGVRLRTLNAAESAHIPISLFGSSVLFPNGNVGIGTQSPNYKLELSTDSAGKPGAGGVWTVVSDERIKKDIVDADINRCYEIVKSVPLKRFAFADGVYTDEQIKDKHNLGWIAQDVQKVFSKAVSVKPFTKAEKIPDGYEEYEEQDYTVREVETQEISIEIRDGKPVQICKTIKVEKKIMLYDDVEVVDENGNAVLKEDGMPLTHKMPRIIKKQREKFRQEVIEDCLDLNSGQLYAAMYGAIQALMAKVEALEAGRK